MESLILKCKKNFKGMKLIIAFLGLFFSMYSIGQIQSDTGVVFFQNEKNGLKLSGGYYGSRIQQKKENENWKSVGLKFPESYHDSLIQFNGRDVSGYDYSFMPYGGLKLNDSVFFMVGVWGTYGYEGVIMRTINQGKDWKVFLNQKHNTRIESKSLFFLTDSIGIVFFSSLGDYAVTYDQGENWKLKKSNSGVINLIHTSIGINAFSDPKYSQLKTLTGEYSLDRGRTWTSIDFNKTK